MFGEPRADRFQRNTRVEVVLMDKEMEEDFQDYLDSLWEYNYASDTRWASPLDAEESDDSSDFYPDDFHYELGLRRNSEYQDELRDHPVQFY